MKEGKVKETGSFGLYLKTEDPLEKGGRSKI